MIVRVGVEELGQNEWILTLLMSHMGICGEWRQPVTWHLVTRSIGHFVEIETKI